MKWDDLSFILGSPLARKIMDCLRDEPLPPVIIAKRTRIGKGNVSMKIMGLVERELIVCMNPERRKYRFYALTEKGKKLLEKAQKLDK